MNTVPVYIGGLQYLVDLADSDADTKVWVVKGGGARSVREYRSIITSERKRRKLIKIARTPTADLFGTRS